jgi:spore maturation protein CgeB
MRMLLVHPGASISTADVYRGYCDALAAQGHDLREYLLDARIDEAGAFLTRRYRKAGKPKPPAKLIIGKACADIVGHALYHAVDWVVIFSAMYCDPDMLVMLRRAGVRTALVFSESPYDDEPQARVAPVADIVFTNERASVPVLLRANPNTHYLPHAYDPDRHRSGGVPAERGDDAGVRGHDVVFVGTLFQERIDLLSAVDWSGIDLGLYGSFTLLGSRSKLRRHIRGGYVDNATTAALYRRAKIGLNLYRTSCGFGRDAPRIAAGSAESLNPRAYELAACGAFHLSDWRDEIAEVFADAVPWFNGPDHLEELVRFYLPREQERQRLAARLPASVAKHTYAARAEQLVSALRAGRPTMHAAVAAGG